MVNEEDSKGRPMWKWGGKADDRVRPKRQAVKHSGQWDTINEVNGRLCSTRQTAEHD